MYGITKVAGELMVNYYFKRYGIDIRSLRYPGIISWKTPPGGGTTDYAVEIFYGALKEKKYTSFLREGTYLPMMYMDDAIRATMELMEAKPERISVRTSYNITAVSFEPAEMALEIKKHIPEFEISFNPDFRQKIADSWPKSIDDSQAREDWGWKQKFGLSEIVGDMLRNLGKQFEA
jgi:nucleoside-diphosphate-sugar epimerase